MAKCTFWYRLTRVISDKVHRAVKWLCVVCVCLCVYCIIVGPAGLITVDNLLCNVQYRFLNIRCSEVGETRGPEPHILRR